MSDYAKSPRNKLDSKLHRSKSVREKRRIQSDAELQKPREGAGLLRMTRYVVVISLTGRFAKRSDSSRKLCSKKKTSAGKKNIMRESECEWKPQRKTRRPRSNEQESENGRNKPRQRKKRLCDASDAMPVINEGKPEVSPREFTAGTARVKTADTTSTWGSRTIDSRQR